MKKYTANLHINANKDNVKFIGTIEANSLKELKEKARQHARNSNNHLSGRIHVEVEGMGEIYVNP